MGKYQKHGGGNYQNLTYYNVALLFHWDRQVQSLVLSILPGFFWGWKVYYHFAKEEENSLKRARDMKCPG
jgi:hypothetical protein